MDWGNRHTSIIIFLTIFQVRFKPHTKRCVLPLFHETWTLSRILQDQNILTYCTPIPIELFADRHCWCFCSWCRFWLKLIWCPKACGLKTIVTSKGYSEKPSVWFNIPSSFICLTHFSKLPVHGHKIGKLHKITSCWLFTPTISKLNWLTQSKLSEYSRSNSLDIEIWKFNRHSFILTSIK